MPAALIWKGTAAGRMVEVRGDENRAATWTYWVRDHRCGEEFWRETTCAETQARILAAQLDEAVS